VLIDEDDGVLKAAGEKGYRYFTGIEEFQQYVMNEVVGDHYYGLPDWASDVDEQAISVVRHIVKHKLPQPKCGLELQAATGEVVGEFELAWPQRRLGIWSQRGNELQIDPRVHGWLAFNMQEVLENPDLLTLSVGG